MPAGADDKGATPSTGTGADLTADSSTGAPKTETAASSKTHSDHIQEITEIRFSEAKGDKKKGKGANKGTDKGANNKDKDANNKGAERRATPESPAPGTPAPSTPDAAPGTTDGSKKPDHAESKDSATDPDHEEKKKAAEKFLRAVAKKAPKLRWDPEHLVFKWEDAGAAAGKPKENGEKDGKGKGKGYKFDITFKAGKDHYSAHIVKSGEKITGSIHLGQKMVFSGAA